MVTAYPVIWSASVVHPAIARSDVTVVIRVTYNTLEAICRDAFVLTETRIAAAAA